jgi:hypothetical protein
VLSYEQRHLEDAERFGRSLRQVLNSRETERLARVLAEAETRGRRDVAGLVSPEAAAVVELAEAELERLSRVVAELHTYRGGR